MVMKEANWNRFPSPSIKIFSILATFVFDQTLMVSDLSFSTCFVTVLKNSKSNIFGKIVVVIIQ